MWQTDRQTQQTVSKRMMFEYEPQQTVPVVRVNNALGSESLVGTELATFNLFWTTVCCSYTSVWPTWQILNYLNLPNTITPVSFKRGGQRSKYNTLFYILALLYICKMFIFIINIAPKPWKQQWSTLKEVSGCLNIYQQIQKYICSCKPFSGLHEAFFNK